MNSDAKKALAASMKYTEETIIGQGAIKGDKGDPGPMGPEGPKGEKGDKGDPGTVENVSMSDLSDVDIAGLIDNGILVYNEEHKVWMIKSLPYVPSKTSELDNDANFQSEADVKAITDPIEAIAKGRLSGYVFDTKDALDAKLTDTEFVKTLNLGDNFYIIDKDTPDYWWDGTGIQELETGKIDLSEYATKAELDEIKLFKFPNAVIHGEPTINNGQISGFSPSNYLVMPFTFDFSGKAFEISMAFTTGRNVNLPQTILGSDFCLETLINHGKFFFRISQDGRSWDINKESIFMVEPNKTYYVKLMFNRLTYKLSYSLDGKTYIDDVSEVSTIEPFAGQVYVGIGRDFIDVGNFINPFSGIINFNKFEIKVNNAVYWEGMDDVGLATRADVDLSNLTKAGIESIKTIIEDTVDVPTKLSDLADDESHRLVSDTEKSAWDDKLDKADASDFVKYTNDDSFDLSANDGSKEATIHFDLGNELKLYSEDKVYIEANNMSKGWHSDIDMVDDIKVKAEKDINFTVNTALFDLRSKSNGDSGYTDKSTLAIDSHNVTYKNQHSGKIYDSTMRFALKPEGFDMKVDSIAKDQANHNDKHIQIKTSNSSVYVRAPKMDIRTTDEGVTIRGISSYTNPEYNYTSFIRVNKDRMDFVAGLSLDGMGIKEVPLAYPSDNINDCSSISIEGDATRINASHIILGDNQYCYRKVYSDYFVNSYVPQTGIAIKTTEHAVLFHGSHFEFGATKILQEEGKLERVNRAASLVRFIQDHTVSGYDSASTPSGFIEYINTNRVEFGHNLNLAHFKTLTYGYNETNIAHTSRKTNKTSKMVLDGNHAIFGVINQFQDMPSLTRGIDYGIEVHMDNGKKVVNIIADELQFNGVKIR